MDFCFRTLFSKTKFFTKNILNYFIGIYLKDELQEDQIELIDDYAQCINIQLDVKIINDSLDQKNIPINLLYGFIGKIKIFLPWKKDDGRLLFEIEDLELSFGPVLRNSSPNSEVVFGSMIDSMIYMQKSFQEEEFSSLLFQEKQKGKNFNALLSKWMSKLCLKFTRTRISLESRPIRDIMQCCRFICQIDLILLESKDNDSLNFNASTLLGLFLRNSIEINGISIHWEIASYQNQHSHSELKSLSSANHQFTILHSSQILCVTGATTCINYTLLMNSHAVVDPYNRVNSTSNVNGGTGEFQVQISVDQIHVLLAPLQLHWLQVLAAQCSFSTSGTGDHNSSSELFYSDTDNSQLCFDHSLSNNVKMTQSQFDSFFGNERNVTSRVNNFESIYYDVIDSRLQDDVTSHSDYDDVPLDNDLTNGSVISQSYASSATLPRDNDTCASIASTFFDLEGKSTTNFKANISIKNICCKLLLHNPVNESSSCYPIPDKNPIFNQFSSIQPELSNHHQDTEDPWRTMSNQFFGLLKNNNHIVDNRFQSVLEFHNECMESDFLSVYMFNTLITALTKRDTDRFHKSYEASCDQFNFAETLNRPNSYHTDENTRQLVSISSAATAETDINNNSTLSDSYNNAIKLNIHFNSIKNEWRLSMKLARVQLWCDISLQDRLGPLLENNLMEYLELNKVPLFHQSGNSGHSNQETATTSYFIEISTEQQLDLMIAVPRVNLNKDVRYWQSRLLNDESIRVMLANPLRVFIRQINQCATVPQNRDEDEGIGTVVDVHCTQMQVDLISEERGPIPIISMNKDKSDPEPTILIKLKSPHQTLEEPSQHHEQRNGPFVDESTTYQSNHRSHQHHHPQKSSQRFNSRSNANFKPFKSKKFSANDANSKTIYSPADESIIVHYIKQAIRHSLVDIEINVDLVVAVVTDKDVLEKIYHRLAFDLVLWESSYEKRNNAVLMNLFPVTSDEDISDNSHNYLSNMSNTITDGTNIFFSLGSGEDDEEEEEEEEDEQNTIESSDDGDDQETLDDEEIDGNNNHNPEIFPWKKFIIRVKTKCAKLYLQNNNLGEINTTSSSSSSSKLETVISMEKVDLFADADMITGKILESQSITVLGIETVRVFYSTNATTDAESNARRLQGNLVDLNSSYINVIDRLPGSAVDSLHNYQQQGGSSEPSNSANPGGYSSVSSLTSTGKSESQSRTMMVRVVMETKLTNCLNHKSLVKQRSTTILTTLLQEVCLRHNLHTQTNSDNTNVQWDCWIQHLTELLSLVNPSITGYQMPDSDTDLYMHMDNCGLDLCFFGKPPLLSLTLFKNIQLDLSMSSTASYFMSCDVSFSQSQQFIRRPISNGLDPDWSIWEYFLWSNKNWMQQTSNHNNGLTELGFVSIMDMGNLDLKFTKIGSVNSYEKSPCCSMTLTNTQMNVHLCGDTLQLLITCLTQLSNSFESNADPIKDDNHNPADNFTTSRLLKDDNLNSIQTNAMLSDAMKDCNNSLQQPQRSTVPTNIPKAASSSKLKINHLQDSDEFDDGFLMIDDKLLRHNMYDRVRNLDDLPHSSITTQSSKLSIVRMHYRPVLPEEDKYTKIKQKMLYTNSSPCFQSSSNLNQQNNQFKTLLFPTQNLPLAESSLLIHDFSIYINIYAGCDFPNQSDNSIQSNHLPASSVHSGSSINRSFTEQNKSQTSPAVVNRKIKSRMVNSMNIKFQRFPDESKSNPISIHTSDYDAYFGERNNFVSDGGRSSASSKHNNQRRHKEAYQLCLSKIFFRYDNYTSVEDSLDNNNHQQQQQQPFSEEDEHRNPGNKHTKVLANQNGLSQRILFFVNSVEIYNRNYLSRINKVMFRDTDANHWFDPKAPQLSVKLLFFLTNPHEDVLSEECNIRLSIQPVRLNIDQEVVIFCENVSSNFNWTSSSNSSLGSSPNLNSNSTNHSPCQSASSNEILIGNNSPIKALNIPSNHTESDCIIIKQTTVAGHQLSLGQGGGIDSIIGSSPLSKSSTIRAPAFDELANKRRPSLIGLDSNDEILTNPTMPKHSFVKSNSPVFIRSFSMFPDLSIRLDYSGTRLDFTNGAMKGLLYLVMQLNDVALLIKHRRYIDGITGFAALFTLLTNEIREEIVSQFVNIVTKFGPMSELTELLSGIYEFFSLPFQHYQNRDSVIEGLKLGTRSITTRSLWAALTLISKGLKLFQKMAETTFEMVSPEMPLQFYTRSSHQAQQYSGQLDEVHQRERDLRDGVTNAAYGLGRRMRNTAHNLDVAINNDDIQHHRLRRPHQHSGYSSTSNFSKIIRQVPAVVASPAVAAFEATSHVIDGLRYQIRPEQRTEDENKWK